MHDRTDDPAAHGVAERAERVECEAEHPDAGSRSGGTPRPLPPDSQPVRASMGGRVADPLPCVDVSCTAVPASVAVSSSLQTQHRQVHLGSGLHMTSVGCREAMRWRGSLLS